MIFFLHADPHKQIALTFSLLWSSALFILWTMSNRVNEIYIVASTSTDWLLDKKR